MEQALDEEIVEADAIWTKADGVRRKVGRLLRLRELHHGALLRDKELNIAVAHLNELIDNLSNTLGHPGVCNGVGVRLANVLRLGERLVAARLRIRRSMSECN